MARRRLPGLSSLSKQRWRDQLFILKKPPRRRLFCYRKMMPASAGGFRRDNSLPASQAHLTSQTARSINDRICMRLGNYRCKSAGRNLAIVAADTKYPAKPST